MRKSNDEEMSAGSQQVEEFWLWELVEKIVSGVLKFIFRIIGKEPSESLISGLVQFVKFGIIGVSNTVISYVLYFVFLAVFEKNGMLKSAKMDYILANFLSFVLSVLWSFYWNNKLVFNLKNGEKRNIWLTLVKTYISYSFTGLFLNSFLLVFWVEIVGLSKYVAPIINLLVSVPVNFLINKFWAFRTKQDT